MHKNKVANKKSTCESFNLNDLQVQDVKDCEAAIIKQKAGIADLYVSIERIKQKISLSFTELKELEDKMLSKARQIAKDAGVDLENAPDGSWNLDTTTMVLSKVKK